jgi:4-oxalocrotonate tautomerase
MPLVRIDVSETRPPVVRKAIADGVHKALVDAIGIPPGDRFQVITKHAPEEMIFDPAYLDIERRNVVYIQIALVEGRSRALKLDLYQQIAANLEHAGVRNEDIVIVLTENNYENWSVGKGEAQLVKMIESGAAAPGPA